MSDIETRYWGRLDDEDLAREARDIANDLPVNTRDLVIALVDRLGMMQRTIDLIAKEDQEFRDEVETNREDDLELLETLTDRLEDAIKAAKKLGARL